MEKFAKKKPPPQIKQEYDDSILDDDDDVVLLDNIPASITTNTDSVTNTGELVCIGINNYTEEEGKEET